ncbi:hypothetical protein [Desulfotomaculum copahuensis]|uniref:hypothetical protein n=1 Tax=Desulfotomaculum copahuensis TaxID=1838280 RepID=UPI001248EFEC|nr:hypothetical protein [Desulfotomaculum copahuensis]
MFISLSREVIPSRTKKLLSAGRLKSFHDNFFRHRAGNKLPEKEIIMNAGAPKNLIPDQKRISAVP